MLRSENVKESQLHDSKLEIEAYPFHCFCPQKFIMIDGNYFIMRIIGKAEHFQLEMGNEADRAMYLKLHVGCIL